MEVEHLGQTRHRLTPSCANTTPQWSVIVRGGQAYGCDHPRAAAPNHYSMQIGVGRRLIRTFTHDWIVGLSDLTLQVRKAAAPAQTGHAAKVHRLFPAEHVYPLTRTPDGLLSPGG